MKIIISPAKKMNRHLEELPYKTLPTYMAKAEELMDYLRDLSYIELKKLYACNDKIAEQNYERLQDMNLYENLTPAILAYEGIQYQYMAPQVFTEQQLHYIENKVCILSGMYGILRPFDGVVPYRLEMQAKINYKGISSLYDFWSDHIYSELTKEDNTIINLASKEYSRVIEPYLTKKDLFITCIFGSLESGKIKVKATEAKMARGEMVRFLADNNISDIQGLKEFDRLEFKYRKELSTDTSFVFIKRGNLEII